MKPFEIKPNIHWTGALHPDLDIFDDLLPTEKGTTYNSYLVKGERKTALIDTVKYLFTDEFIANLKDLIDPSEIDYLVCQHSEPDHGGSIGAVLDLAKNATVVCSVPCQKFLGELMNASFKCQTVKDDDTIDLGGRMLRFFTAPQVHWPDTMFSYLGEEKILFPNDAFGTHYCDERMYNDLCGDFQKPFDVYFDAIMRPFKPKVLAAISKIRDLDIEMICPSHGPILRKDPWSYVDAYEKWSTVPESDGKRVLIVYLSAHENTRRMAEEIVEGIKSAGGTPVLLRIKETDHAAIRDELEKADGLIFGTATIGGDVPSPMWGVLGLLSTVFLKAKRGAAFGSFGWSGEAVGMIEERLRAVRIKVIESGLRFKFTPTEEDLSKCRAFGADFVGEITG
ncbi:MAG: FprA family A-type flavoprotein [Planctomycetes bacterium]|nr:FprA family A-type flavoprotein [Planctomycetota bacterium]